MPDDPYDIDPLFGLSNTAAQNAVDPLSGLSSGAAQGAYNTHGPFNPYGSGGSIFDNKDFRRHAAYDALTNAGLSLIAASGPSPYPQNFGTMFGSLAAGAAQGAQGSADRYMKLGTQAAQMRMLQAQAQAYPEAIRLMRSASGGGGYDPYGGSQPQQAPAPQGASPTAAPPGGAGITDNNVGNVESPPGSPTRFQQVPDFNSGVALTVKNARAYPAAFNQGQPMTLMQVAERWAPAPKKPGDDQNDPKAWAFNVSRFSGLPADKPLNFNDPLVAASFARGVHGAEKGAKYVKPTADYMPGVQTGAGWPGASGNTATGRRRPADDWNSPTRRHKARPCSSRRPGHSLGRCRRARHGRSRCRACRPTRRTRRSTWASR